MYKTYTPIENTVWPTSWEQDIKKNINFINELMQDPLFIQEYSISVRFNVYLCFSIISDV